MIVLTPLAFLVSRFLVAAQVKAARQQLVARPIGTFQDTASSDPSSPLAELGDAGKMFAAYSIRPLSRRAASSSLRLPASVPTCLPAVWRRWHQHGVSFARS